MRSGVQLAHLRVGIQVVVWSGVKSAMRSGGQPAVRSSV